MFNIVTDRTNLARRMRDSSQRDEINPEGTFSDFI